MNKKLWKVTAVSKLYELPLFELIFKSHKIHRKNFNANEVELCTLLNVKTGACPENCSYCPQSGHYDTGLQKEKLLSISEVINAAKRAKEQGATRFCMGAAWRNPPEKDWPHILNMIKAVKNMGLETCVTLGMLTEQQAKDLKAAELNYYNHNLDTSPEYYKKIISTRTYQERLDTLRNLRQANIKVCCGGIIGMGESRIDRMNLLIQLANLPIPPESVPINRLIPIKGTPLEMTNQMDNFEFIRTVAVARVMMPTSMVRLSAGRMTMSEEMQALCFFAGANSIHFGEKLLVTPNRDKNEDLELLKKLGIETKKLTAEIAVC